MGWLRISLRRLGDERSTALALVCLVLGTAFVAAAAPRALGVIARDALRAEISAAQAPARNITLIEERRVFARTANPLLNVETLGERREERIPEAVRALFVARRVLVDTPRWSVLSATLPRSTIAFRIQPGAADRVRVIEGTLPTASTRTIAVPAPDPGPTPEPPPGEPPPPPPTIELTVLEVALSVASADLLQVGVGDVVELRVDATDRLARGHEDPVAIEVVATFQVLDPADDFWLADQALVEPSVREISSENAFFDATALLAPDAYPVLMAVTEPSQLPLTYTWRFHVEPDRLEADTADFLLAELRRLESQFPTSVSAGVVPETVLRTGLVRLLDAQRVRWRAAEAVLTVIAAGPAAIAGAAVALVSVLAAGRRRRSLVVWRSRGASLGQVAAATLLEAGFLFVPAAAIACGAALALVPGQGELAALGVAGSVAAIGAALLLAAVLRSAAGGTAGAGGAAGTGVAAGRRAGVTGRRIAPRRVVLESLIVVLALIGAILLRERGVRGVGAAGALDTADPFIAAVPLLAGLAAGLLAIRITPLPMAVLAGLAAIRRDLVPVLGLRRATRAGTNAVLVVLLATTAVGGFASAALVHLDRSADAVAWQEVGADFRLTNDGRALPVVDPAALPVEAAAAAFEAGVPIGASGALLRADLVAVDTVAFAAVVRGTASDGALPPQLFGAVDGPIPAILGPRLAEGSSGLEPGEVFELSVDGSRVRVRAIEFRPAFPAAPLDGRFVIVSLEQLEALRPDDPLPNTSLFLRADPSVADEAVAAAVSAVAPRATFESRSARAASLRAGPIAVAVTAGIWIATVAAGAYAAIAVIVAFALAAAARAGEAIHLRTLGLSRTGALGLLAVEHGPVLGFAFAAGAVLGYGLFALLRPGLGFEGIIGSAVEVAVDVDPAHVGLLLAAIGLLGGIGLALGALIGRRGVLAAALRRGIE
jgi:putative ABC transport system permease protein